MPLKASVMVFSAEMHHNKPPWGDYQNTLVTCKEKLIFTGDQWMESLNVSVTA